MPTIIEPNAPLTTLINVFETTPDTQQQVVELLIAATEQISKMPGFRSANFHCSTDGQRVVNYAQWTNAESMRSMLEDPDCKRHVEEVARLARYDAHIYDVVSVHSPAVDVIAASVDGPLA
jgi:quinol monooxygenase YgiN